MPYVNISRNNFVLTSVLGRRGRTLRATRAFRTVFRMNREDDVFATFSCLPFELRCRIWEEAVPGPRIFLVE